LGQSHVGLTSSGCEISPLIDLCCPVDRSITGNPVVYLLALQGEPTQACADRQTPALVFELRVPYPRPRILPMMPVS
jgi:hypothetical protein